MSPSVGEFVYGDVALSFDFFRTRNPQSEYSRHLSATFGTMDFD